VRREAGAGAVDQHHTRALSRKELGRGATRLYCPIVKTQVHPRLHRHIVEDDLL
jgi:hypothetical protein